jgi:phosphohistidine phosphatase
MELILWRHAEADDAEPDADRTLTPKGRKQARRVAHWLLQRLPARVTVLSSPALRAQETAHALGMPVKTADQLAPGATISHVLRAAHWPAQKGVVVIVGHQPDLGCVAAHLVCSLQSGWTIKKGGLWWLTDRVKHDEAQVVVRAVVSPDLL